MNLSKEHVKPKLETKYQSSNEKPNKPSIKNNITNHVSNSITPNHHTASTHHPHHSHHSPHHGHQTPRNSKPLAKKNKEKESTIKPTLTPSVLYWNMSPVADRINYIAPKHLIVKSEDLKDSYIDDDRSIDDESDHPFNLLTPTNPGRMLRKKSLIIDANNNVQVVNLEETAKSKVRKKYISKNIKNIRNYQTFYRNISFSPNAKQSLDYDYEFARSTSYFTTKVDKAIDQEIRKSMIFKNYIQDAQINYSSLLKLKQESVKNKHWIDLCPLDSKNKLSKSFYYPSNEASELITPRIKPKKLSLSKLNLDKYEFNKDANEIEDNNELSHNKLATIYSNSDNFNKNVDRIMSLKHNNQRNNRRYNIKDINEQSSSLSKSDRSSKILNNNSSKLNNESSIETFKKYAIDNENPDTLFPHKKNEESAVSLSVIKDDNKVDRNNIKYEMDISIRENNYSNKGRMKNANEDEYNDQIQELIMLKKNKERNSSNRNNSSNEFDKKNRSNVYMNNENQINNEFDIDKNSKPKISSNNVNQNYNNYELDKSNKPKISSNNINQINKETDKNINPRYKNLSSNDKNGKKESKQKLEFNLDKIMENESAKKTTKNAYSTKKGEKILKKHEAAFKEKDDSYHQAQLEKLYHVEFGDMKGDSKKYHVQSQSDFQKQIYRDFNQDHQYESVFKDNKGYMVKSVSKLTNLTPQMRSNLSNTFINNSKDHSSTKKYKGIYKYNQDKSVV